MSFLRSHPSHRVTSHYHNHSSTPVPKIITFLNMVFLTVSKFEKGMRTSNKHEGNEGNNSIRFVASWLSCTLSDTAMPTREKLLKLTKLDISSSN